MTDLRYPADAVELSAMLQDPEFRNRAVRAGYGNGRVTVVSDLVARMRELEGGAPTEDLPVDDDAEFFDEATRVEYAVWAQRREWEQPRILRANSAVTDRAFAQRRADRLVELGARAYVVTRTRTVDYTRWKEAT